MYYNTNIIIKLIKENLNLSYYEINRYIEKADVKLKSNEIKNYLEENYIKKHPGAKERLIRYRNDKKNENGFRRDKDFVEMFMLELEFESQMYDPYTLEYFKKYINILKKKCNNLIRIIDGLIDETIPPELLKELDINLDENGNILMDDVLRISKPFIYNFNELKEMVNKANSLETYLNFKISLDDVYRNGFSEDELYPGEKLQDEYAEMFSKSKNGYIPLTEKQKKLSRKKENEYILAMCDIVKNM